MKARIKKSGRVISGDIHDEFFDAPINVYERHKMNDVEILEGENFVEPVDWTAFRREAAKDFMSAIITREAPQYNFACRNVADRVTEAVMWADELIKQLKEEKA